nr:TniQ family protein [Pseudomonas sp. OA65]
MPKPHESAMSLLFRCATGNGISTAHLLRDDRLDRKAVTMTSALWQGSGPCELLASHTGFTAAEKDAITSCFYRISPEKGYPNVEIAGMTFPLSLLKQHLALCPGCAREGHLNQMHIFSFSEICPVHSERYITQCPSCCKPLLWTAINDYICPCKYDLRETLTVELNMKTPKLFNGALEAKDERFFATLVAAIAAMRFAHTPNNRGIIVDSCARIATGNKSNFFREIDRIQELFPSLHRRALLAPFVLSDDATLREYAMEYLFRSSQTQPLSHSSECQCGELSYTRKELGFIFDSHNVVLQRNPDIPLNALPLTRRAPKSERRYQCPDFCKVLYNRQDLLWDNDDTPGEPGDNFEVLSLTAAAEVLDTKTSTVRALIVSGLLKGHSVSYPNGLRTSLEAVQKFGQKYVLRSEVVRRSGLSGASLRKLLAGFTPIAISIVRFGSTVLVYQRKHLSEGMRLHLEKKDLAFLQPPLPADGMVTFGTVCKRLNLASKDVRALRDVGILLTAPFLGKNNRSVSERCTQESLQHALEWRKQHLSISELAKECGGYGTRTIYNRFLDTAVVPFIKLDTYFVSIDAAKFIVNHLSSYITWNDLCSMTGMSQNSLVSFVEEKLLIPLPQEHPDAIKGLFLFKADEAEQFATDYQRKRTPRRPRSSTIRKMTARPPKLATSLTTPELLDAIVRSYCFPVQS